jgi:hypothetical protein
MNKWQQIIVIVYGVINFLVFIKGFYESKHKKNAYGLTPYLFFLGVFVWGDAVIFGLFWTISSLVSFLLHDWFLFLLTVSVFWITRSLGETIYWFNQQFSDKKNAWNEPKNLLFHSVFHNDSIWFIYQIMWQCVTVISVIFSIYFVKLWII